MNRAATVEARLHRSMFRPGIIGNRASRQKEISRPPKLNVWIGVEKKHLAVTQ